MSRYFVLSVRSDEADRLCTVMDEMGKDFWTPNGNSLTGEEATLLKLRFPGEALVLGDRNNLDVDSNFFPIRFHAK